MNVQDVPYRLPFARTDFEMADLLHRANQHRAKWTDLPKEAGIYVVYLSVEPQFQPQTAHYAKAVPTQQLQDKWYKTQPTPILYIGKAANIRNRVRALVKFGVGKVKNHRGGEWLWQISNIQQAKLITQTCPRDKAEPFESWLLAQFKSEHKELPLANRKKPRKERWRP